MADIDDLNRLILQLREEFASTKRRLAALIAEEEGTRETLAEIRQRLGRTDGSEDRGELLKESARLDSALRAQVRELEEARRVLHRLGDELEGAKRRRNLHIVWMKRRPWRVSD
jgi:chromosome segregation ATPase